MDRRFLLFLLAAIALLLLVRQNSNPPSHSWQWQNLIPSPRHHSNNTSSSSIAVTQDPTPNESKHPEPKRPLKIAIVESMGWHDEVYAAYVQSFFSQPDVEVSLLLKEPRWGMPELLKTFQLPLLPEHVYYDINALNLTEPDIIISVTCEYDLPNIVKRLDFLFERKKTYLFCTGHYAAQWDHHHEWMEPILTKWIEAGLLTIVTLSPHVREGFHKPGWGLNPWESLKSGNVNSSNDNNTTTISPISWPPIDVFVPVFPPGNDKSDSAPREDKKGEVSFAIQGGVTDNRDYSRVMNYLADLHESDNSTSSSSSSVSLHIIGSGGWEASVRDSVPDSIQDSIFFDNGLDYVDYYAYLSTKTALIPAFSKDDYLTWLSSSSIPASLIAGIPLIATREMLKSYSYLKEAGVYVQEDGETEGDAIRKVVGMEEEARRAKKEAVRKMRESLMRGNVEMVAGWIEMVRVKMGG